ncbi:MAG TPA: DUF3987 domain-containing protein, partial [Deinococcales bacterium]|nr:DUF3987 domain-containing protein [Deinococcales bacterium]
GLDREDLLAAGVALSGNPAHAKALYAAPAGVPLHAVKLTWPHPDGPDPTSGKPRSGTVFELRAGKVQDVLPPSVHPGTKRPYTWPDGVPASREDLPPLPPALLDLWAGWEGRKGQLEAACPWAPAAPDKAPAAREVTPSSPRPADRLDNQDEWDALRARLREEVSLEAMLADLGAKKVKGNSYLCPFHEETHPSFWTFKSTEGHPAWYCSHGGTRVGSPGRNGGSVGDVIDLYQHLKGLATPGEATVKLAEEKGLKLPGAGLRASNYQNPKPRQAPPVESWPDPAPLPPERPRVPTMTPDMIPAPLRAWLLDEAERASLPVEMFAGPAIVACGSLIGRQVSVKPQAHSFWKVVPNLWGVIISRPGTKKSHALNTPLGPVFKLQGEANEEYRQAAREADLDETMREAEAATLKASLKKAKTDPATVRARLQELRDADEENAPCWRRYYTSDATVEKIGEILQGNPTGLLIVRDELSGLWASFERPDRQQDRQFYLEAWNGTGGPYMVDRIGRGTLVVPPPCVSMIGTTQPGKLAAYVNGALAGQTQDDGFLQRYQVIIWPDHEGEYRQPDGQPSKEARETAYAAVAKLARLDVGALGAVAGEDEVLPYLPLSGGAQECFDAWFTSLEGRLRGRELEGAAAYAAHVGKYRSLLPSLALIFHLLDVTSGQAKPGPVGRSALLLALRWLDFLDGHARKVYAPELNLDALAARALAGRIEDGDVSDGVTVRELQRKEWSGLRTKAAVDGALRELERVGWLKVVEEQTGGRPSSLVYLNPAVVTPTGRGAAKPQLSETRPWVTDETDNYPAEDEQGPSGGFGSDPPSHSGNIEAASGGEAEDTEPGAWDEPAASGGEDFLI